MRTQTFRQPEPAPGDRVGENLVVLENRPHFMRLRRRDSLLGRFGFAAALATLGAALLLLCRVQPWFEVKKGWAVGITVFTLGVSMVVYQLLWSNPMFEIDGVAQTITCRGRMGLRRCYRPADLRHFVFCLLRDMDGTFCGFALVLTPADTSSGLTRFTGPPRMGFAREPKHMIKLAELTRWMGEVLQLKVVLLPVAANFSPEAVRILEPVSKLPGE